MHEEEKHIALRFLSAVLPLLIFLAVFEIAGTAVQLLKDLVLARGDAAVFGFLTQHGGDADVLSAGAAYALAFLSVLRTAQSEVRLFAGQRRVAPYPLRSFRKAAGERNGTSAPERSSAFLFLIFAGSLCLSVGINVLLSVTGLASYAGGAEHASVRAGLGISLAVYGILTPLIEEYVFRGMTYLRLRRLCGSGEPQQKNESSDAEKEIPSAQCEYRQQLLCMMMSALLFGAFHGNLPQGCYAFVMGMLFAAALEVTGRIGVPAAMHACVNLMAVVLSQTGVYAALCTPGWCAFFLGAGAVCSGTAWQMMRQR